MTLFDFVFVFIFVYFCFCFSLLDGFTDVSFGRNHFSGSIISEFEIEKIEIFDSFGILKFSQFKPYLNIDLKFLIKGIYFVTAYSNDKCFKRKIILN